MAIWLQFKNITFNKEHHQLTSHHASEQVTDNKQK